MTRLLFIDSIIRRLVKVEATAVYDTSRSVGYFNVALAFSLASYYRILVRLSYSTREGGMLSGKLDKILTGTYAPDEKMYLDSGSVLLQEFLN
ncbi:MAG: hypothetical protein ABSG35_11680 [Syntrophobacteraceae bacterium]|jgi:hypothetical protein